MLKLVVLFFITSFFSISSWAQEKLVFAIDVVRHGDRTPVIASPEMEKIWPQGMGQLTPEGMRQEYLLGDMLRRQYVLNHHLLPKAFDMKTMYVRSSDYPRTLMSAQSILLGLYPLHSADKDLPQGFQPIPIHTVPKEEDSLLIPDHDKEQYIQLLQTYIASSPDWTQKEQELKPYYETWSACLGNKIHNLFDLINISDRLFIEGLYEIALPQCLSKKEVETIIHAGKWAWLDLVNYPKFAELFGRQLFETIANEMKAATESSRDLKYLLFVAHDSTIAAQLHLLGQRVDEIPPYASILHYGLYDLGDSRYEVRVTYNDKPLFIKACNNQSCALNDFVMTFSTKSASS